ncbi:hypothetical protein CDD80_3260 [Ophiocordyceps camponoti-rufipedis]|uniref:Nudix hydrolase domain-containing protein n=1 Tax=Ophiocordyceps camponoti-rufipedis TaxID=2004952 RepID=A0A2C5ZDK4_9HYPO|nr:hypothetical protein CDD80_3260 [Ophiocordyceps camponoti-rufipedis]
MMSCSSAIDAADKFPYGIGKASTNTAAELSQLNLYALQWEDGEGRYSIGYMLDRVVEELLRVPVAIRGPVDLDRDSRSLILFQLPTEGERSRLVAGLASYWRENDTFKLLRRWRDENYPVYGRRSELLFSIERSAMGLFGTVQYGAHLTAYVDDSSAPHGIKMWVAKRSANKQTFPSMLDNTVAGGLVTGEEPFDCITREADEEASLPVNLVQRSVSCAGTVTYIYISEDAHVGYEGLIYPECQWVYDLPLPASVIPRPKDGEAEQFFLCDVDQIKTDIAEGKYKPNCALVVLDFFIRHGILTEADEPDFNNLKRRLHRELPFPGPHSTDCLLTGTSSARR